MSTRNPQRELFAGAIIIPLFIMQRPTDVAETIAVLSGAMASGGLALLAAHFAWTPILKKAGFWLSSLFLGCAILALGLAAAALRVRLGGPGSFAGKLAFNCALAGLLFSWVLAALRGAQNKKSPTNLQSQRPRSVLFRPSPPRCSLASGPTEREKTRLNEAQASYEANPSAGAPWRDVEARLRGQP